MQYWKQKRKVKKDNGITSTNDLGQLFHNASIQYIGQLKSSFIRQRMVMLRMEWSGVFTY